MHWVFAYGSNMHVGDLARWLRNNGVSSATVCQVMPAVLPGHRLVWNYYSPVRRGGAANVEPEPRGLVLGLALRVDDAGLAALDRKEGHPQRYAREEQTLVRLERGFELLVQGVPAALQEELAALSPSAASRAWVYRVQPAYRRAQHTPPRRAYLQLMLQAAEQHGFPAWYVGELTGARRAGAHG